MVPSWNLPLLVSTCIHFVNKLKQPLAIILIKSDIFQDK